MTTIQTAGALAAEIYRRISGISIENGFETDIGIKTHRGRRKLPADDEIPCASIFEGADDPKDVPARVPQVLLTQVYVIDAFDKCEPDNPNDKAHQMLRDMKRAIFADGTTLGNRVKACDYLGRDIGPRPDGVGFVQARIMIAVQYVETLAAP